MVSLLESPMAVNIHRKKFKPNCVKPSVDCSVVSDSFVIPWTVAPQSPLAMEFSRQECWSWLSFPSVGDFPNREIEFQVSCIADRLILLLSELWLPLLSINPHFTGMKLPVILWTSQTPITLFPCTCRSLPGMSTCLYTIWWISIQFFYDLTKISLFSITLRFSNNSVIILSIL